MNETIEKNYWQASDLEFRKHWCSTPQVRFAHLPLQGGRDMLTFQSFWTYVSSKINALCVWAEIRKFILLLRWATKMSNFKGHQSCPEERLYIFISSSHHLNGAKY